jgi:hypothetical protein
VSTDKQFGLTKGSWQMTAGQDWGGDFAELRSCLERAHDKSCHLASWRTQLGPADVPADIVTLVEDISKAQSIVNHLFDRLHSSPLGLLTHGHPMSREAYYLLVALGVLRGGSCAGDPYSHFQMTRYEDDERRSYICLDEPPHSGGVKLHLGLWPEEISWDRLRPDQRDFFNRHLPEVAARFKRQV